MDQTENLEEMFKNKGKRWDPADDTRLVQMYKAKKPLVEIATLFHRTVHSIVARLKTPHGLIPKFIQSDEEYSQQVHGYDAYLANSVYRRAEARASDLSSQKRLLKASSPCRRQGSGTGGQSTDVGKLITAVREMHIDLLRKFDTLTVEVKALRGIMDTFVVEE